MTGLLGVFDLETTGVDVENDRIVSAYIGVLNESGILSREKEWLVDPGIEIPEGATAVHGITTDRARMEGIGAGTAAVEIGVALADLIAEGIPIVIYNAPYDLTLLDRELRRHGTDAGIWFPLTQVIDPLVLDKAMDPYRKGSRRLADTARHYAGPSFVESEWHGAKADATAAGRLARILLADDRLVQATPAQIHGWQITWHMRQANSFIDYLERKRQDSSGVRVEWPIVPWRG